MTESKLLTEPYYESVHSLVEAFRIESSPDIGSTAVRTSSSFGGVGIPLSLPRNGFGMFSGFRSISAKYPPSMCFIMPKESMTVCVWGVSFSVLGGRRDGERGGMVGSMGDVDILSCVVGLADDIESY